MAVPDEGAFLPIAPDLAVEILSASTASRDRGEKKAIYEKNGVREYWIIDPRARTLAVFTLTGDRFDKSQTFDEGQPFHSSVLTGLELDVAHVLV